MMLEKLFLCKNVRCQNLNNTVVCFPFSKTGKTEQGKQSLSNKLIQLWNTAEEVWEEDKKKFFLMLTVINFLALRWSPKPMTWIWCLFK